MVDCAATVLFRIKGALSRGGRKGGRRRRTVHVMYGCGGGRSDQRSRPLSMIMFISPWFGGLV